MATAFNNIPSKCFSYIKKQMGLQTTTSEPEAQQLEPAKHLHGAVMTNDNFLICPLSVDMVIAMIYQGAAGQTADKLASFLNVNDQEEASRKYKTILDSIDAVTSVTINSANKVYVMSGSKLKANFKEAISKNFNSEVDSVNFVQSDDAANQINQWVEEKTNRKIKDLIKASSLNGSTRLVLVNAIYFKGSWHMPFPAEYTEKKPFFISKNKKIMCDMMFNPLGNFCSCYDSNLQARLLELPYVGKNIGMLIIMPGQENGIEELGRKLSHIDLSTLLPYNNQSSTETEVSLPKFKMQLTIDLKAVLMKMGLDNIFNPSIADFSQALEESGGLYVSEAIQKVFIEVNEEGSEAAAASECVMCLASGPRTFHVNSPFIFVIRMHHGDTSTVLFVGKVLRPEY